MKLLPTALALLVLVPIAYAFDDSVTITGQKITVRRPKPMADFKRTFTVNRPRVKDSTPALARKIERAISYETVLQLNIAEEKGEYQWLEEADYEVGYNKKGLLSVRLSMVGTAAYPSASQKTVVIDLRSGNRLKPGDLFVNLDSLSARIKKLQQKAVDEAIAYIKKDPDMKDTDPAELFANTDFTAADLDEFALSDTGVTFIYDYGFPHVIEALEPDTEVALPWAELKSFIKRDGLLARLVR